MAKFRINEAIAQARVEGRVVMKKDIAAKLWPDSNEVAQQVNFTRLCAGKTPRIQIDWVPIICSMCGCTADFLFGIE